MTAEIERLFKMKVSPDLEDRLMKMVSSSEARDLGELIVNSLALQECALEVVGKGGEVFARNAAGDEWQIPIR